MSTNLLQSATVGLISYPTRRLRLSRHVPFPLLNDLGLALSLITVMQPHLCNRMYISLRLRLRLRLTWAVVRISSLRRLPFWKPPRVPMRGDKVLSHHLPPFSCLVWHLPNPRSISPGRTAVAKRVSSRFQNWEEVR